MAEDMLSQEELDALLAQHRGATQEAEKDTPDQESSDDYSAFDVTEFLLQKSRILWRDWQHFHGICCYSFEHSGQPQGEYYVPSVHITTPRKLSESYPIRA